MPGCYDLHSDRSSAEKRPTKVKVGRPSRDRSKNKRQRASRKGNR
jgi:hypothetical protein